MTGKLSRRLFIQTAMGGLLVRGFGTSAGARPIELAAADEPLTEPVPSGAVTVRTGTLRDGDPIHRGSGTARILQLPDGSHAVRLENLEVVRGPTLFVYLVVHEDPLFPEDVMSTSRRMAASSCGATPSTSRVSAISARLKAGSAIRTTRFRIMSTSRRMAASSCGATPSTCSSPSPLSNKI